MNETIGLLISQTSARSHARREISRIEKDLQIQCAMRASMAGNLMLYSVLEADQQQQRLQGISRRVAVVRIIEKDQRCRQSED